MKIPRITPVMLRQQPDQVSDILGRLIDKVNSLDKTIAEIYAAIEAIENEPIKPYYEYHQVLAFDPTHMGTTPGMCLQNCREGFGIPTGTFPNANADMESQMANGTLHSGVPPENLQVPVYVESGTPDGHVVVWDRGTVWSDGHIVQAGLSDWQIIYGWGELCDGTRVVHIN